MLPSCVGLPLRESSYRPMLTFFSVLHVKVLARLEDLVGPARSAGPALEGTTKESGSRYLAPSSKALRVTSMMLIDAGTGHQVKISDYSTLLSDYQPYLHSRRSPSAPEIRKLLLASRSRTTGTTDCELESALPPPGTNNALERVPRNDVWKGDAFRM